MKLLKLIGLICTFASPIWANDVLVSISQQSEVTRLVLTFENRPDWVSDDTTGQLSLVFNSNSEGISFSIDDNFFSGRRIKAITPDPKRNSISIELACDCSAQVYPYGDESLIVEIRDEFGIAAIQNTMPFSPNQPITPKNPSDSGAINPATDHPLNRNSSDPLKLETGFDIPPQIPQPSLKLDQIELGLIETLGFTIQSNDVNPAVEYLSRELSRAAALGLVEPGTDPTQTRQNNQSAEATSNLIDRSNISVVTSFDRDILAEQNARAPTDLGTICISDTSVDLTKWGNTSDISTLGLLRRDAYSENGDINPEGAHAIARYYIALGFGAEASSAATFMPPGKPKDLILALAQIVDYGFSSSPILDGQIFCDGKVALWAALARPIEKSNSPVSVDSILKTFSALPAHQRAHLGPVLAERLREIGLKDAARNAVNAIARGGLQSNESELVTARMALDGTRPSTARETLVKISTGTDVTAAQALLELLEDAERRQMAPNPNWVDDAPSLARATEGTDIAAKINIAGLKGLIALGHFDQFRHALAEDTPGLNAQVRSNLAASALVAATHLAEAPNFLRAEVGLSKLIKVSEMLPTDRFSIAKRLLDIGLVERAAVYVTNNPTSVVELTTVADILTNTGQTERAIRLLSERPDEASARKLGQILNSAGQVNDAIAAYERSGSLNEAAFAAIRSGNWEWIAARKISGESGSLSETTRLLNEPISQSLDSASPGNGDLIQTSREIRRRAAALMSETSMPNLAPFTN